MKMKKLVAVILAVFMIAGIMTGCGSSQSGSAEPSAVQSGPVTLTDDAGRAVEIPGPADLEKVYVTSPIGFIQIYTFDPEILAGTPMKFSEGELKYLDPVCAQMENLGGMQVGAELNKEAIMGSGAQIIFSMNTGKITDTTISDADELQEQLGIPVLVLDANFDAMPASYRRLGEIFGMEDRAEELAVYCENVLKDVEEKISTIPAQDRVTVYYAEKEDGLATEPAESSHAAVLNMAGADIVAKVEVNGGGGMSPVSMEQVLSWNPEVIISWGEARGGAYNTIKTSPEWSTIQAVKDGRVYSMPNQPFSWIDRPPSVNRYLGVQWMANLLYPDVYDIDIRQATKDFYKMFYHKELTDDEVSEILAGAVAE